MPLKSEGVGNDKMQKHETLCKKRAQKGTLTFPACSGLGEKNGKKGRREDAKRKAKNAKKKQWIPAGAVTGGKSSAEKACKMSKKATFTSRWYRGI